MIYKNTSSEVMSPSRLSATRGSFHGQDTQTTSARSSSSLVRPLYTHMSIPLTSPGIFMIAVSPAADGYVHGQAYKALYATILGPIFLTILLMFVSGLTLQERPGAKKRYEKGDNWEAYARWLNRTSILIPFPPALYQKLPTIVKRTIFLEFPIYVFDPVKHSDMSQGQAAAETGDHANGSTSNLHQTEQQR